MVFFLIMYNDGVCVFFSKDLVYVWRNMFFVVF